LGPLAVVGFALLGCNALPSEQSVSVLPPVATLASIPAGIETTTPVGTYLIAVNDELEVKFPDRPDLNEIVRVRPDGQISLRLINSVQADGRTPGALEADIARLYRELSLPVSASTGGTPARRYLIGVGDELEIKFSHHQGLDQAVKIRPDGMISLGLVKAILAEGKTPEELEAELERKYQAFLKRPDLVVIVRNYATNRAFVGDKSVRPGFEDLRPVVLVRSYSPPQVFVGGEVARPGVLAFRGRLSVLSAIIESGGLKPTAQTSTVMVLRRTGPAQAVVIRRDLRPDQTGTGTNDIYLEPFDIVLVPKTPVAEVGEFMEQLFGMLPPLKNSSFGFIYQINSYKNPVVVQ
jgi:polysaccharide export outer membrane protein